MYYIYKNNTWQGPFQIEYIIENINSNIFNLNDFIQHQSEEQAVVLSEFLLKNNYIHNVKLFYIYLNDIQDGPFLLEELNLIQEIQRASIFDPFVNDWVTYNDILRYSDINSITNNKYFLELINNIKTNLSDNFILEKLMLCSNKDNQPGMSFCAGCNKIFCKECLTAKRNMFYCENCISEMSEIISANESRLDKLTRFFYKQPLLSTIISLVIIGLIATSLSNSLKKRNLRTIYGTMTAENIDFYNYKSQALRFRKNAEMFYLTNDKEKYLYYIKKTKKSYMKSLDYIDSDETKKNKHIINCTEIRYYFKKLFFSST